MYQRILVAFAALMFTVTLVPGIALAESSFPVSDTAEAGGAADSGTPPDDPCAWHYYYAQLGAASKKLYDALIDSGFARGPKIAAVTADLSDVPRADRTVTSRFTFEAGPDQRTYWNTEDTRLVYSKFIEPALAALTFDHPELSWLDGTRANWSWTTDYMPRAGEEQSFVLTSLTYEMDETGYEQATKDCDAVAAPYRYDCADTEDLAAVQGALRRAVDEIGQPQKRTQSEVLRAVHDWLCRTTRYADKSGNRYLHDWRGYQTAYSALVLGETVCAGYAKAFKLLCEQYGIPCVLVEGTSKGEQHMWNYVQADGVWYGVDCTWDDTDGSGEPSHQYFLRGADEFTDHTEGCTWDRLPFRYPAISPSSYYSPAQSAGGTEHFMFEVVDTADACMIEELSAALESCRSGFEHELGGTLPEIAALKIYPSVWAMEAEGFTTAGSTQFAAYKPATGQIGVLSVRSEAAPCSADVTAHARRAYASCVLQQLGTMAFADKWLSRGFALYADGQAIDAGAVREDMALGKVPRLADLVSGLWAIDHLDEYYEAGVLFIVRTYGGDAFKEMLRGRSVTQATGTPMTDLEQGWDAFINNMFSSKPVLADGSGYTLISDGSRTYLKGVSAGTPAAQLASAFIVQQGTDISGPAGTAATGQRLVLTHADRTESEVIVVVGGDVLGTGSINLTQLVAVASAFAGTRQLAGPYLAAADWSGTGRISLTDLVHEAEIVRGVSA